MGDVACIKELKWAIVAYMVTLHTRHSQIVVHGKYTLKMVHAYVVVLYAMSRIHPLSENHAVSANGPRIRPTFMHVKRSRLWPRSVMTLLFFFSSNHFVTEKANTNI